MSIIEQGHMIVQWISGGTYLLKSFMWNSFLKLILLKEKRR
jgi:hypothetical protein